MPFDKREYQRRYMARKRAVDPSYGQPSSKNGYEEEYEEEWEQPQLTPEALILIIIGISLGILFLWILFKFLYKEPQEEEPTI